MLLGEEVAGGARKRVARTRRKPRAGCSPQWHTVLIEAFHDEKDLAVDETGRHAMAHVFGPHFYGHRCPVFMAAARAFPPQAFFEPLPPPRQRAAPQPGRMPRSPAPARR